ncbi:MAG: tripartite tricarboxylate transporter permease [Rhodobacteraceae bacterium]|jgi:putative tricarboxylic transport membrane protein|nr:tripartite tricarboxylate transporter permease [Paracoccaceae bacterium]
MLEAAWEALQVILQAQHFMYLMLGVAVGVLVGPIPGVGGLVGMTLLLPMTYGLDPAAGLAMLVGVGAVNNTSDTFPAILMGVPGGSGSQATIMDGYPMTQRGEAARALSASFIASMIGGVIGAFALTAILPIARPLILSLGTPELLMISVLGLCTIGMLSGNRPILGLIGALFGLLLGTIGSAPVVPEVRFTGGLDYLFDGIPLVVLAMGLFALPEMIDILARGGAIASKTDLGKGWMDGVRDVIRYRWLVLRHSLIGAVVGAIPGLGSSLADWLNYGYVVQTAKDKSQFGKGDVRGIIAPESANNAKEGGNLIPTLLFGIPGSAGMAILLAAMVVMGVQPGPRMVESNLSLIFVIVWSLAIANVAATLVCVILARPIARLTLMPFNLIFPVVFILIVLGSYQATRHVGDLIALIVIGVVGWAMKRAKMPRPPLLVGFILAPLIERDLWITSSRYGFEWLLRPGVMIIAAVILAILGAFIIRRMRMEAVQ